ncbi:hypothetical protein TEA_021409 [Camellia sinensis var. sinensis]|uniref:DUF4005 domain-containing protein n=2 Tax=Camellia sinensis TaxID=4442 RepID=A0A4S4EPF3_CAMSN|nr:hypothetical protein TEA_021409 [Camellia sinensis var. sinensis]
MPIPVGGPFTQMLTQSQSPDNTLIQSAHMFPEDYPPFNHSQSYNQLNASQNLDGYYNAGAGPSAPTTYNPMVLTTPYPHWNEECPPVVLVSDFGQRAMGKSPEKWIKSVLFGKKSSKSNFSEGRELLASSPTAKSLRLQYNSTEPNSVLNWLERWSASLLWKPIPSTKKVAGSKSQKKKVNPQTVDPETGRVKLSVRRIPSLNLDNVSTQSTSETEKPRRNLRKVSSHPADSVQEHPQNELEKVKRSLRKVHNPNTEGTIQSEADSEKPKYGLEKVLSFSDQNTAEENISDSGEKIKKGTTVTVSKLPDIEATLEPPVVIEANDLLCDDQTAIESQPRENSGKHEGIPVTNGELRSREDITVNESQKSARTASSAAKQERAKNGVQNRPAVPSYMAATESAKAKLKA